MCELDAALCTSMTFLHCLACADDDAQPVATKKRARVETSGSKVSGSLADVCTKLELLLSLLAQVNLRIATVF
jgi:hypothetical protein